MSQLIVKTAQVAQLTKDKLVISEMSYCVLKMKLIQGESTQIIYLS